MKKILSFSFAALLLVACGHKEAPKLATTEDTLSWALGETFAMSMSQNKLPVDNEVVLQAFRHTLEGGEQPFDEAVCQAAYSRLLTVAMMEQKQLENKAASSVESQEQAYFEKLMQKGNAVKTEQGFYYEVLQEGKGPKAQYGQRVSFDYKGYLMLSNKLFDQSEGFSGGTPIIHVLGNPMFKGLQEGMQLMSAGSTYRFYFPNKLAFGAKGSEDVPPYTAVIYEVTLHEIMKD